MNNIKLTYKILEYLDKNIDNDIINIDDINHKKLNISKTRWIRIIEMLVDGEYIKGVHLTNIDTKPVVKFYNIRITFKGLELLYRDRVI